MGKVPPTKPHLVETTLAAIDSFGKCKAARTAEVCQDSLNLWQEVAKEAGLCPDPAATQHFSDGQQKWSYDCASIQNAAQSYVDGMPQWIEHLKLKKDLAKAKPKEKRYTPDNLRPPEIKGKVDRHLTAAMHFSPPLSEPEYIRTEIHNRYDSKTNEWISKPENLKRYSNFVTPTHHYSGPVLPTESTLFYHRGSELLVLPIPDGFSLNTESVLLNGSRKNFDVVQDDV